MGEKGEGGGGDAERYGQVHREEVCFSGWQADTCMVFKRWARQGNMKGLDYEASHQHQLSGNRIRRVVFARAPLQRHKNKAYLSMSMSVESFYLQGGGLWLRRSR